MYDNLRLRRFHRFSAFAIAAYLILHLSNHIVGLAGQQYHQDFMVAIRPIYRNPVVEPLLLVFLLFQIGSGMTMVVRSWRTRRGWVAWAQALSGAYLAVFLLNHVISVFIGRYALSLDTDFRFAAAGMHVSPFEWFFAPYYFLSIAALFTHVGCAFYWQLHSNNLRAARIGLFAFSAGGMIFGIAMVASLGGVLYPVDIPDAYLSTYDI